MAFTGAFSLVGNIPLNTPEGYFDDNLSGVLFWYNDVMYLIGSRRETQIVSQNYMWSVDLTTAALTDVGAITGLDDVIVSGAFLDGTTLYLTTRYSLYTLDFTTRVATQVGSATEFGVSEGGGIGLVLDGTTLYMAGYINDRLYTLNKTTGVATAVDSNISQFGVSEGNVRGLAILDGVVYMVGTSTGPYLSTLNIATGVATAVDTSNTIPFTSFFAGFASDGDDLYLVDWGSDRLYIATKSTPATAVPDTPVLVGSVNADKTATFEWTVTNADAAQIESFSLIRQLNGETVQTYTISDGALRTFTTPVLDNGTYGFSLVATNAVGNSFSSNSVTLTIADTPTASVPDAPTLSGTVNAAAKTVTLNWNTPANNGSALTGFVITQTGQALSGYVNGDGTATSFTTPALVSGTYSFTIVATNDIGSSASSNTVTVIVTDPVSMGVPDAPVIIGTVNTTAKTVTLSWTPPGNNGSALTGYTITQSGQAAATYTLTNGSLMSYTTDALVNGSYTFTMVATNAVGNSAASNTVSVTIADAPAATTPLNYASSVTVDTNIGSVLSADADDDGIYLLTRSSSVDTIYSVDVNGAVQSERNITFNGFNYGLARVGSGFAYGVRSGTPNPTTKIVVVDNLGNPDNTITVRDAVDLPSGLIYRETSSSYILLLRDTFGIRNTRAVPVTQSGSTGAEVQLFSPTTSVDAIAASSDTYYIVTNPNATSIPQYDVALNALGTVQTRHSDDTAGIRALAFRQGQLIVVTGTGASVKLSFYGGAPAVAPVSGVARRQLLIDSKSAERFDFVKGTTSITSVLALNSRATRSTAIRFVDVPGTQTLQQRLEIVEITPEYTVPGIEVGDRAFLHTGDADTEPTSFPASGVYVINNIISTGNNYTQTFVCTEA